jgi:hypothetical protein
MPNLELVSEWVDSTTETPNIRAKLFFPNKSIVLKQTQTMDHVDRLENDTSSLATSSRKRVAMIRGRGGAMPAIQVRRQMRPNLLSSDCSARTFLHHWGLAELWDAVAFNGLCI